MGLGEPPTELGMRVYEPPLPGLRMPLPGEAAGSSGNSQLGFESEAQRVEAGRVCEGKVAAECIRGARSSCVVAAVRHCKPGPLQQLRRRLLGLLPGRGGAETISEERRSEREVCEDRFAARCTDKAVTKCDDHSQSFCKRVYSGVPVHLQHDGGDRPLQR
eukprot:jgi/Tetstr1/422602/TSEL_013408.t1